MTNGTAASRRPHSLVRSYSSGALPESEREREFDTYDEYDLKESSEGSSPSAGKPGRSSLPPVSRHSRASTTTTPNRSSVGMRTSTSSVGSRFSLEVTPASTLDAPPTNPRRAPATWCASATHPLLRHCDAASSLYPNDRAPC
ncbi:hypothetical protein BDZ97DRAFT_1776257 [Flammula alnicola]|nr:hypothetical protein BDZ97DRAFT_1776257 [Flammula alnicola]